MRDTESPFLQAGTSSKRKRSLTRSKRCCPCSEVNSDAPGSEEPSAQAECHAQLKRALSSSPRRSFVSWAFWSTEGLVKKVQPDKLKDRSSPTTAQQEREKEKKSEKRKTQGSGRIPPERNAGGRAENEVANEKKRNPRTAWTPTRRSSRLDAGSPMAHAAGEVLARGVLTLQGSTQKK